MPPPPEPAALSCLRRPGKRPHNSHLASASTKRRLLCSPLEVAGALRHLRISKRKLSREPSSDDDDRDDELQTKRHSPERREEDHKKVWATVVPLDGKPQRIGIDPALLSAQPGLISLQPNQIVKHCSDSSLLLKLAAQCLGPNKCVYVATPTGTVWKASLFQTLHNGLPFGPPEIRAEEFKAEDEAKKKPQIEIRELPALQNSTQLYGLGKQNEMDVDSDVGGLGQSMDI